jgi:hypothetical protein
MNEELIRYRREKSRETLEDARILFRAGRLFSALIGKDREIRFIESKMPWDSIRPNQVAGLKLIKKYVTVNVPVRVSIINLHPEYPL